MRIDSEGFAPLPEPPEQPLPSLAKLAGPSFRPSPLLPYELLQLLVAYCAVLHFWNGKPDCGGGSSESSSEGGWEAAEQLLLLAPPLAQQAARVTGSSATQPQRQGSKQHGGEEAIVQQQQQQEEEEVPVVADSVRCACVQLADAAAVLHSELRALLQQATADALALLQLGRAAVLLALTDSCRCLERGRLNLKQQRQQQKQQQQQQQRSKVPGNAAGRRSDASSKYSLQQSSEQQQQQVLLEQQLKFACRKLVFFQVWSNEQEHSVFEQLSLQLAVELREQQAMSTPAAAGVKIGVQPVQPVELPGKQQQQQQQQRRRAAQVMQEAAVVRVPPPEESAGAAPRAANGEHHQQQQQQPQDGHVEQVATQVVDTCMQPGVAQQQQQQQQLPAHIRTAGSSAPISNLYELD
jgi:hypothetical protein